MMLKEVSSITGVLLIVFVILLWQFLFAVGAIDGALLSSPGEIINSVIQMLSTGELLSDALISLSRVIVGFILGAFCAILVGLLTGTVPFFSKTLGQIIHLLRPIPVIAIVPLALVWFGIGEVSKYFLIFWGVFFPIWINTHLGATHIKQAHVWVAQSLGANRRQLFFHVIFPSALPMIIAGMRTGIAIAYVCLVAAEMAGAFGGIGYRIYASHMVFRVDKMMAGIMLLGILGAVTDKLFYLIVGRLFPWYQGGKPNVISVERIN